MSVGRRCDCGWAGQCPVDEDPVELGVEIGGCIGQYEDPIVLVGGLADCGQYYACCRNAADHQCVDRLIAENGVEVGGAEGAETGLADDEVGVAYFQGGVDVEGWISV